MVRADVPSTSRPHPDTNPATHHRPRPHTHPHPNTTSHPTTRHRGTHPPPAPQPESLRITEIMSDPIETGPDAHFEWVELVNTASVAVSTGGWSLGDSQDVDALPAIDVPPGGYVVVAGREAAFDRDIMVIRIEGGTIGSGLNNGGDVVRLMGPSGDVADSISYGDDATVLDPPPRAPSAGMSLSLVETDEGERLWVVTGNPTPGSANKVDIPPDEDVVGLSADGIRVEDKTDHPASETERASTVASLPVKLAPREAATEAWVILGIVVGVSFGLAAMVATGRWWRRSRGAVVGDG